MKELLEQLHQLTPLAAAATAGRWNVSAYKDEYPQVFGPNGDTIHQCIAGIADAAFTAAARNVLTPENLTLLAAGQAALAAPAPALPKEADTLYTLLLVAAGINEAVTLSPSDCAFLVDGIDTLLTPAHV